MRAQTQVRCLPAPIALARLCHARAPLHVTRPVTHRRLQQQLRVEIRELVADLARPLGFRGLHQALQQAPQVTRAWPQRAQQRRTQAARELLLRVQAQAAVLLSQQLQHLRKCRRQQACVGDLFC